MKNFARTGLLVTMILCSQLAIGQKSAEMFIPIGQSPGLSGKHTRMGQVNALNAKDRTFTMKEDSSVYTVKLTDRTKVWLDKSQLKLTCSKGTFADLQPDRLVEIKYEKNDRKDKGIAEWIKIQLSTP